MSDVAVIFVFISLITILIILCIWSYFYNKKLYEETSYFNITNIPYSQIREDVGHYGEFLIYKTLKDMELENAKFLFNLYIPT